MTESSMTRGGAWADDLLTPQSSAIAGFTFAVLSMVSYNALSQAIQLVGLGSSFAESSIHLVGVLVGLGGLVLAALGILLGRRASEPPEAGWAAHLGRAAQLVGWLGVVSAVIAIIGDLLR